jgi:hypothetical protein
MSPDIQGNTTLQDKLFAPAKALMDRLRYVWKFALIGLLFIAPLVGITALQFSAANEKRAFNQKEVHGVEYLIPVHNFSNATHRHRLLMLAVQAGDAAAQTARVLRLTLWRRPIKGADQTKNSTLGASGRPSKPCGQARARQKQRSTKQTERMLNLTLQWATSFSTRSPTTQT